MNKLRHYSRGFTLIEVLIALAIVGALMSAIYAIFIQQTKTYTTQDQIAQLQQSLRFGMSLLERDLRKAGYNPGGLTETRAASDGVDNDCDGTIDEDDDAATLLVKESEAIGFLETSVDRLVFSQDENGDGNYCVDNETIYYLLSGMILTRNGKPLSDNIEVINFVYLSADDNIASHIEDVRSVQIALIGRTEHEDSTYTNTTSYANLQGTEILPPQNDGYRRRLLTSQVHIRNLND